MKIKVNVPTNSANSFCVRLYTYRLRGKLGAAAPDDSSSESGAILLEPRRTVKESDALQKIDLEVKIGKTEPVLKQIKADFV